MIEEREDGHGLGLLNVAHIDLIMESLGSYAEQAFCRVLTDQKDGANSLLAITAPNLMTKPATLMFNKVTIKNGKQAIKSAVAREPKVDTVLKNYQQTVHPFQAK